MQYSHRKIEKKWQKEWLKKEFYKTSDKVEDKKNFYALIEFPYPSGNLHAGHWYAYAIPDIFARMKRMQGLNIMFPIGFDAFGLPAENAAIKHGKNPKKWTYGNIDYMREQLNAMGSSFDWSREVITCDPDYYKWTQWIFLQFFKKGLAYQGETCVNWCPSCKTVLANEQVNAGWCERCGSGVEQKMMKQWMLKITDYADKLLEGSEKLDWPKEIKDAQRNWIGKSEGAMIDFKMQDTRLRGQANYKIQIFTTRPDTLFGATYMVLAPEHKLVEDLKNNIENWNDVEKYIKKTKSKTELERQQDKEKTGIELKGIKAINPANNEEIPIWIADYVLAGYGTGAIMAVPAHDERDYEFAKKFNIEIIPVIDSDKKIEGEAYINEGKMINSGKFNGMDSEKAKKEITEFVHGKLTSQYKLRDWVVSRQRYWGVPIPIIHCEKCGAQPVDEKELPVELPEVKDYMPTGDGKSPLAKVEKWVNAKCPKCGEKAERETDTLDTFVDSSWYFLRYCDPKNKKEFASQEKMKKWMPVDIYSGGAEHTTMHLLYSRFFIKAMHDLKLIDCDEPYTIRRNRGIILGPDGQKMSKSRGNVVDPDEYVKKFGADTVRMYLAFIGPYNEVGSYPWDPQGILGIRRFLDRVWNLGSKKNFDTHQKLQDSPALRLLHKTIKKVTEDVEEFKFNTAISQLMIFSNLMDKSSSTGKAEFVSDIYRTFLILLSPFAPYITEEIWHNLGNKESIHQEPWPKYDSKLVEDDVFQLVIQVDGKLRDSIEVPMGISQKDAEKQALASKNVQKYLNGKKPKKVIFVPKRLINIVI
ncbi:leucine--tRNA ligase [Patescibacteria group bacterium]